MIRIDDCFREGLLKRTMPDKEKARISLKMSEKKLSKSREALEKEISEASIIFSYSSMFHAARALFFNDGITERSHICVSVYVRENYSRKGLLDQGFLNTLDELRRLRHKEFYGLSVSGISKEEASEFLGDASDFIKAVRRILKI